MAKIEPSLVVTPKARLLAFQPVNEATAFIDPKTKKEKGEKSYRATLLIPKTENMDAIKAAMQKAAKVKNASADYAAWKKCVKDGNKLIEKAVAKGKSADRLSYYKDHWVIEAKSKFAPDLSKAVNGTAVDIEAELVQREFYSGCYVKAELNFVASEIDNGDDEPNRYISAYHNFLVKVGDGDRLGRKSRTEVFKGALGGSSSEDPSGDEDF
jgi:hypothetical protein